MLEDSSPTVPNIETAFFSASAKGYASAKPRASAKEGRAGAVFDLEAELLAIRLDPKGVVVLMKAERRAED